MRVNSLTALLGAGAALMAINAHAQVVSTDGGLGVYDPVNNVTWTSNANLFAAQLAAYSNGTCGAAGSGACEEAFVAAVIAASGGVIHDIPNSDDTPPNSGTYTLTREDFYGVGYMTWYGAQAWVNYLNATNYGGSNQWGLPTTVDNISSEGWPDGLPLASHTSPSSSQMGELFYGELGLTDETSLATPADCNANCALFSNWQGSGPYWSGTQYSASPNEAWQTYANGEAGGQFPNGKSTALGFVLAVSTASGSTDGPIPPWAIGALGVGLLGLGARRLRSQA